MKTRLTSEQVAEAIGSYLYLECRPSWIARQLRISRREVLRHKRKWDAVSHQEEKYPPALVEQVIRLSLAGATTQKIAWRLRIPAYQVRRVRRDYRLPAPGRGRRYPITLETTRALGREFRLWQKAMAAKFSLPLRTILKLLRRKP